jgi:hypothetical protein
MKASMPIIVIAGAAGVWLGFVLVVLKSFGIHIPWASEGFKKKKMRTMDTSHHPDDNTLIGAEIMFGPTQLGHVEGLVRDPVSSRVRRLITTYGPAQRRVAIPMEWVVQRTSTRLVLCVGALSLDDLADQADARHGSAAMVWTSEYKRLAKE